MFSKHPFLLIWEYIFSFSHLFLKVVIPFCFVFLISCILTICEIDINTPPHLAWSSVAQTPEFDSHWPNPGFLCIISGVCTRLVINSREYWFFEGTGSQEDNSNMHTAYAVYQCCRFCLCNFCSTSAPLSSARMFSAFVPHAVLWSVSVFKGQTVNKSHSNKAKRKLSFHHTTYQVFSHVYFSRFTGISLNHIKRTSLICCC